MKFALIALYLGNTWALDTGLTGADCVASWRELSKAATVELEPGLSVAGGLVRLSCEVEPLF